MKVAVIGGGGREHAIIKKIKESPLCQNIVAIPGNGGIAKDCQCININAADIAHIVEYCANNGVDYVVVAPDEPLALGLVDALKKCGIAAFGPLQKAAQIESSKVFAKNFMQKYGIPTANYHCFSSVHKALKHVKQSTLYPIVVKADGLALGKGVLICNNEKEAVFAIDSLMNNALMGDSGKKIVIEEFLKGPEVSVLAFCDGKTLVPMLSAMDYKRALDNDKGENTGGMGAIAPNPYYTGAVAKRCMDEIFIPTQKALLKEGITFSGCLYFGLMLTTAGPKVIEYNARFGDPETQALMPLLQSDLLEIMLSCTNGCLKQNMVKFSENASACIVVASKGYPRAYEKGFAINGLEMAHSVKTAVVYHAGTVQTQGGFATNAGRVLGVTAKGKTLKEALNSAYAAAAHIKFEGAQMRKDIGKTACEIGAGALN